MEKHDPTIKDIITEGLRKVPETVGLAVADILATQRPLETENSRVRTVQAEISQNEQGFQQGIPDVQNRLEQ